MIVALVAASVAAASPQATPPAPAMDHSKMDHSKMNHGSSADAKPAMKMDCCKDGCACCAKDKAKPTS